MKLSYYPKTDSIYISLREKPGAEVVKISDDEVVDVDEEGDPVGIDISGGASAIVDLSGMRLERQDDDSGGSATLQFLGTRIFGGSSPRGVGLSRMMLGWVGVKGRSQEGCLSLQFTR